MTVDKAGKDFWDASWSSYCNVKPIDPNDLSRSNEINLKLHSYFQSIFQKLPSNGLELLEIGCARSQWLPYFAKEYGFLISGLDYSKIGCEQEREILRQANIPGHIICADVFNPPESLIGKFDVVISLGVAEHFEDTSVYLAAAARLLKEKGLIITLIPNLTGLIGWVQKNINRKVYDIHVPLTAKQLAQSHHNSGIDVSVCDYLVLANFGMCNLNGLNMNGLTYTAKRLLIAVLRRFSQLVWLIEDRINLLRSNQQTATYIACIGQKRS